MRKARFIAALAVVSMMLLAASAMPRISNGASKPLTIYMVGFTQQQAFWHAVQHGAEQAGKDFGATVKYEAPAGTGSDADMISLLDAAVAARPNGIAIEYAGRDMQEIRARRRAFCWRASTNSVIRLAAVMKRTRRRCRHAATHSAVARWVLPVPDSPSNTTGSVRSM